MIDGRGPRARGTWGARGRWALAIGALALAAACNSELGGNFGGSGGGSGGGDLENLTGSNFGDLQGPAGMSPFRAADGSTPTAIFVALNTESETELPRIVAFDVDTRAFTDIYVNDTPPAESGRENTDDLQGPTGLAFDPGTNRLYVGDGAGHHEGLGGCTGLNPENETPDLPRRIAALIANTAESDATFDCPLTFALNDAILDDAASDAIDHGAGSFSTSSFRPVHLVVGPAGAGSDRVLYVADEGNQVILRLNIDESISSTAVEPRVIASNASNVGQLVLKTSGDDVLYAAVAGQDNIVVIPDPEQIGSMTVVDASLAANHLAITTANDDDDIPDLRNPFAVAFFDGAQTEVLALHTGTPDLDLVEASGSQTGFELDELDLDDLSVNVGDAYEMIAVLSGSTTEIFISNEDDSGSIARLVDDGS